MSRLEPTYDERWLTRQLVAWFRANARDLPWRRDRTGYTALVAESMLQQTQVARVAERFVLFMERFPTVRDLAQADEQEVLAMWQGLGYYRRARLLHAAARMIVAEFDGEVPATAVELQRLPGVGRYSAGSIASIVFGEAAPIVDGNVVRVLARRYAREEAPDTAGAKTWTWNTAERLVLEASDPGVFNESLMELGATVCTPASPRCGDCPIAAGCHARAAGRQTEIPPPKIRAKQTRLHHHVVVIERGGSILLQQRAADGLWGSMWQPPTVESTRRLTEPKLRQTLGVTLTRMEFVDSFEYQTTHRRIAFHVYRGVSRARRGIWRHRDDVADLPMSNAVRRVLALLAA